MTSDAMLADIEIRCSCRCKTGQLDRVQAAAFMSRRTSDVGRLYQHPLGVNCVHADAAACAKIRVATCRADGETSPRHLQVGVRA